MTTGGKDLYQLVCDYAGIGHHRTGTDNDATTRQWISDELAKRGADPFEIAYSFPQFIVDEHVVTINGTEVESLPLWYAGAGRFDTSKVQRRSTPFEAGTFGHDYSQLADEGNADFDAVVVATTDIDGLLGVPNRAPVTASDLPHALIPGRYASELEAAEIHLSASLRRGIGTSASVFARFGPPSEHPILVTTPLSGWFTCAGERGTGIAIALALASELGNEHAVLFVGTTGHEIGYLGVSSLVASQLLGTPAASVHLGASIAAGELIDGELDLSSRRNMLTTSWKGSAEAIEAADEIGGFNGVVAPDHWWGEGQVLQQLGGPLLSFLGGFPLFHTSLDTPERATAPALLSRAHDGVSRAVAMLADATVAA